MNAPDTEREILFDDVPKGKVVQLTGEGGIGKTTVLTQVAMTVASGHDFGIFPETSPTPHRVVMILGEDELRDVKDRMKRILSSFPVNEQVMNDLNQNIRFIPLYGKDIKILTTGNKSTSRSDFHAQLIEELKLFKTDLLIYDSFSRASNAPENDNNLATEVVSAFETIAMDVNCAVVFISHTGKPTNFGQGKTSQTPNSARGASAIGCSVRKTYVLTKIKDNPNGCKTGKRNDLGPTLTLSTSKTNIGKQGHPLTLTMNSNGTLFRQDEHDFIKYPHKSKYFDLLQEIEAHPGEYTPRLLRNKKSTLEKLAAEAHKAGYLEHTAKAGVKRSTKSDYLTLSSLGMQKLAEWKNSDNGTHNPQKPIQVSNDGVNMATLH